MPATARSSAPAHRSAAPIRVLVVDDSAVTRAVLERALAACPDILVVAQAASAARALALLEEVVVDLILLDLEMPGVNGLGALPFLTAHAGGAPVLVVSASCLPGAKATAHALRLGAAGTLPKPSGLAFAGAFSEALVDRVRCLARARTTLSVKTPGRRPAIVGVAGSTGGVAALGQFVTALPPDFDAPILVTQHMPESFMPFLVRHLADASGRPTRTAETGMQPLPGEILVAPGHAHLTLCRTGAGVCVQLYRASAPSGCQPSADPMFASLARTFGAGATAVVLSGMGRDGAEGAAELAAIGALVFAQDQASSVVWGMPGAVARQGLAHAVLPPWKLAGAVAGQVTALQDRLRPPAPPRAQLSGAGGESGAKLRIV